MTVRPYNELSHDTHHSHWLQWTIVLIVGVTASRIGSLSWNQTGLFFDEAQYWLWGQEPDFGYFSKPPLLGWIIGFSNWAGGSNAEFWVRLPSPVIHGGTAFVLFLTGRRLFDARTGFFSSLIYLTLPGVGFSSNLISTDVPLLFCYALALWLLVRFQQEGGLVNALGLGVALGMGLLAKYAMIYFVLCLMIYVIADRSARQRFFHWHIAMALGLGVLILTPNLIWVAGHDFVTASHTGDNIGWRGGLNPLKALEFLGSQFGVFGPVLMGIYIIALVRFLREGMNANQRLLVLFSAPILAIILVQALMSKAYANWAALTYVAATLLVSDLLVNHIPAIWNRLSLAIHGFVAVVLAVLPAFANPGVLNLPGGVDPFVRMHGWREIARSTEQELAKAPYGAVIAGYRHVTAELVYYLRNQPVPVLALSLDGKIHDHYQLTRPLSGQSGMPVLLVSTQKDVSAYQQYFANIRSIGHHEVSSGQIKDIWFFRLDGYKGDLRS